MTASTEVLIGDSGAQHVLIRALSRSQPDLFDQRDGNWIDCELRIVVGSFKGDVRANLRSEEFQNFLEEVRGLIQTLEGTASFTTLEGQIALYLTGDGKGQVHVSGEAIDVAGTGNRLQFAFDVDQTYLEAVCQSLENLLTAFPVLDGSDA